MRTTVMAVSGPILLIASVEREQEANRKRSRVRARVEHVFAQQANRLVRSIGQVRPDVKIDMVNLVCNTRRSVWLAG